MRLLLLMVIVLSLPVTTLAANPLVQKGQQLFTQPFNPTPLGPGGDGLGPLFNHVSCVACHHSGGVGGAGDHRFNARSFAIAELRFDPRHTTKPLDQVLASINPLLRGPGGDLVNAIAIHRHGGTPEYDTLRQSLISRFNPDWDREDMANSDGVRAEATGQIIGDGKLLQMRAHIFARNTTALFGAGLIDRVPDSVILQQARAQKRYAEINGRPATLADGRLGKFGWRANFATLLEFNENACVNELGLQTKQVPQASDPTDASYSNPAVDIDNDAIAAMTQFVASLPAPTRAMPSSPQHAEQIALGENRFAAIGCAICHVPDLGPAKGIYSDLLLHDMGSTSVDYSAAPPYRRSSEVDFEEEARFFTSSGYYGHTTAISLTPRKTNEPRREFVFRSPERAPRSVTEPVRDGRQGVKAMAEWQSNAGGTITSRLQMVIRSETIPTNINQEWRTPPLWGLRDSAPYMHDGRAETILEAIAMHEGEAARTRNRFYLLSYEEQLAVLAFLESLIAPTSGVIPQPPDFTSREIASY